MSTLHSLTPRLRGAKVGSIVPAGARAARAPLSERAAIAMATAREDVLLLERQVVVRTNLVE